MNHLKWMGHTSTIMDIQRVLLNQQSHNQSCEVMLVAKDGVSVRAHLFVLSTCSDLMRNLLVDLPVGQEATVILPDIRALLTDFLEAINLLGIKSAISFETNPSAMNTSSVSGAMALENAKSISGLHIANSALMEEEEEDDSNAMVGKLEVANTVEQEQTARPLEFLDVYGDTPKITYSIEHMSGSASGNQYILTESTGTYTITQSAAPLTKLETAVVAHPEHPVVSASAELQEDEAEAEVTDDHEESESQIIEEEYVPADPMTDMGTDADVDMHDEEEEEEEQEMLNVKPRKMELDVKVLKSRPRQRATAAAAVSTPKCVKKTMSKQHQQFAELKKEIKEDINDALDLAADAVLHEGLSLQKAADRYDISKTVLWRRVRSNPAYMRIKREKPSLSEAYERLKNGDSLKSISQDLHIPMSTLHRHKVRLAAQGRLPEFVACRRRDSTPKDELRDKLAKAVHACINDGMSQNHAANLFEIPKSTLWRHLQRHVAEAEQKIKEELEKDDDAELN
ncbi:uncharacterized protein LOC108599874 isoform X2 [Drosophila busckii]|uniref:uncharacterized protein LOC108599874 isoform X2 n=1 Tax=Drosophila busckii TaxID=30019 RepID=UPI00083F3C41|nr:uncharacterized protein LOC108599874 isoform X2 [Drosophila busckii]